MFKVEERYQSLDNNYSSHLLATFLKETLTVFVRSQIV